MPALADFSPSLDFFDAVYGDVMVQIPVSLDSPFLTLSGDAGVRFSGSCTCTADEGGWCQLTDQSGEEWVQRPFAEDDTPDFFIN